MPACRDPTNLPPYTRYPPSSSQKAHIRHLFPPGGVSHVCYAAGTMTIREAHNLFLSYGHGQRNYARETLTKLRDCFRAWILPVLGDIEIQSLTRLDVARLRTAMIR
jgi:hypothetical protein